MSRKPVRLLQVRIGHRILLNRPFETVWYQPQQNYFTGKTPQNHDYVKILPTHSWISLYSNIASFLVWQVFWFGK